MKRANPVRTRNKKTRSTNKLATRNWVPVQLRQYFYLTLFTHSSRNKITANIVPLAFLLAFATLSLAGMWSYHWKCFLRMGGTMKTIGSAGSVIDIGRLPACLYLKKDKLHKTLWAKMCNKECRFLLPLMPLLLQLYRCETSSTHRREVVQWRAIVRRYSTSA